MMYCETLLSGFMYARKCKEFFSSAVQRVCAALQIDLEILTILKSCTRKLHSSNEID